MLSSLPSEQRTSCGTTAGSARLGDRPVSVSEGAVRLADGTLAGSCLTLDQAGRELATSTSPPLAEALAAASVVPARLLGLERDLLPGRPADLVLLGEPGEPSGGLAVERVMIAGGIPTSRHRTAFPG